MTNGTGYAVNTSIISAEGLFDVDSSYDLRLSITDSFGTVRSLTEIPTAFTLLDFNASGRGVAFGKVSEVAEGVEFALPLYSSHPGKVLWSGAYYMTEGQAAQLSEPVSKQLSGIVLVFGRYSAGVAQNYHYNHFFVPKAFVSAHPGVGSQFFMTSDGSFAVIASKYLYINDESITGNTNNNLTGTTNGITFNNAGFVLRYVIGV